MNPQYPFQPQQQPPVSPQPQQSAPQQPYASGPQPAFQQPAPQHSSSGGRTWLILSIVFIFTTVSFGGAFAWAMVNYLDQKSNVDGKIESAVNLAVKDQKKIDADNYAEAEKEPLRSFKGPDDYGSLSFQYPKTWSAYEVSDATDGGTYEIYFNPGIISPISDERQYALHVTIEDTTYDSAVENYAGQVESGELKSSPVTINGQAATRLEGSFSDDIKGAAVIMKIRDKTATIRTDARTFLPDFNKLVQSITFNK